MTVPKLKRIILCAISAAANLNRKTKLIPNPNGRAVVRERMLTNLPEIYSPADWETFNKRKTSADRAKYGFPEIDYITFESARKNVAEIKAHREEKVICHAAGSERLVA